MIKNLLFIFFIGFSTGLYAQNGSVCVQIFNDLNGNGLQDEGEAGVEGITIYVVAAPPSFEYPLPHGAITDATGNYCFTELDNGQYTFEIEVPEGWELSGDPYFTIDITNEAPNNYYRRAFSDTMSAIDPKAPEFTLYPNPAGNILTITGISGEGEIIVYDTAGKSVLRQQLAGDDTTIDVSRLSPGVYIAHLTSGTASGTMKFFIAR